MLCCPKYFLLPLGQGLLDREGMKTIWLGLPVECWLLFKALPSNCSHPVYILEGWLHLPIWITRNCFHGGLMKIALHMAGVTISVTWELLCLGQELGK